MKKLNALMASAALALSGIFSNVSASETAPIPPLDSITAEDVERLKQADLEHQALWQKDIDSLIADLKTSDRNGALYIMGQRALERPQEHDKIIPALIEVSKEWGNGNNSWQAAYALELISEKASTAHTRQIANLYTFLLNVHGNPEVRAKAVAGLGTIATRDKAYVQMATGSALRALVGENKDHDSDVRHKALRALAFMAVTWKDRNLGEISFSVLRDSLLHDEDSHVRWQGAISMGLFLKTYQEHGDRAMVSLKQAIDTDTDKDVVAESIQSMGSIAKINPRYLPATKNYFETIAASDNHHEDSRNLAKDWMVDFEKLRPKPRGPVFSLTQQ